MHYSILIFKQSLLHLLKSKGFISLYIVCLICITLWIFAFPYTVDGMTGRGIIPYYGGNTTWFINVLPVIFVIISFMGWVCGNLNINDGMIKCYLDKPIKRSSFLFSKLVSSFLMTFVFIIIIFLYLCIIHLIIKSDHNVQTPFLTTDVNPFGLFFSMFFIGLFSNSVGVCLKKHNITAFITLLITILCMIIYIFVFDNYFKIGSDSVESKHDYWFSSICPNIFYSIGTIFAILLDLYLIKRDIHD
jgi:ABC-type transport system involved in multi-copper enzyme maturation permease subunit